MTVPLVNSVENSDGEDGSFVWGDGGQLLVEVHTDSGTECASPPLDLLFNYVIRHFGAPDRCAGMVAQATRSVNLRQA